MTTNSSPGARERARAAKTRLDEKRAEKDKLILAATTDWYTAIDDAAKAAEALESAQSSKAEAVRKLSGLGQSVEAITELCDAPASEIRALRKLSKPTSEEPPPSGKETGIKDAE